MARSGDLYDVLGVAKDASPQDIKKAFRVRARECHPDVAGGDPEKAEAFKRLREAYEVLSDPAERARYDRRGERRTNPFYGSMWNRGPAAAGPQPTSTAGTRAAGNDLDLEDIFNDFSGVGDFGFTGQTRGQPGGRFKGGAGGSARPGARPGRSGFTGGSGASGASGGATGTSGGGTPGGGFHGGGGARSRPEPGDFTGWNEGNVRTGAGAARPTGASGNGTTGSPTGERARRGPQPGRDIPVSVDVPAHVARDGGTVTVTYQRLRRADDGHTLYRYDELHDLKVPPGTRHGDTLRVAKMGDAGLEGGAYGELVVDVRVAGQAEARGAAWDPTEEGREGTGPDAFSGGSSWGGAPPRNAPRGGGAPLDPPEGANGEAARKTSAWSAGGWTRADGDAATGPRMRFDGARVDGVRLDAAADGASGRNGAANGARDPGRMRMPGHEAPTTADGAVRVDVGVVVALLGGRVTVPTPAGPVRVNVPAGTSSGTRMRLRGRGPAGPDGAATDLVAELRIVVPKRLDDESRRLIERFGELNPEAEESS